METGKKRPKEMSRGELAAYLRKLAEWKNNDVVKLAFLEADSADQVDQMDLSGVVELKRNANGTFEAKFAGAGYAAGTDRGTPGWGAGRVPG